MLPKHALANNLWLGKVPHELSMLTLPEQLLISRHFPRCYVVKLYPWEGWAFNPKHLQQGIKGNVSLYNMNTNAIVEMLEGQLLPHPAMQLASVLVVTLVGSNKLPKKWLKTIFRVRRRVVFEALWWLKRNNELYRDIVISYKRLQNLPEDDIPVQLVAGMQHEPSGDLAAKEQESYIPSDESQGELVLLYK